MYIYIYIYIMNVGTANMQSILKSYADNVKYEYIYYTYANDMSNIYKSCK